MTRHPLGEAHTRELLRLSGLAPPARLLDMGAGDGDTLRLLRALGFEAVGVDLKGGEGVEYGDLLRLEYPGGSFDAAIAQCSFFLSGDVDGAFREAYRLIRPGGALLWSDVSFTDAAARARRAGFAVEYEGDMTAQWREYYIESLWRGTADCLPARPEGKCAYTALICRKELRHGSF